MARVVVRRGGGEGLAARHQEIDDVVAQRVIMRVLVQIDARAIPRQRVLDDLRQHGAGAVGHQKNLVGKIHRLVDVMGDHEGGLAGLQRHTPHLVLQRAAGQRVERRERLVHQHDLRRDRQRARDADALLHAAGQFRRPLVLRTCEADLVDIDLRMGADFRLVPLAPFRRHRIGDVAHHREPRQQRVALKDHRAVETGAGDRLAVDDDGAFAGVIEPGEDVEYRRLAAAGMADDAAEFA